MRFRLHRNELPAFGHKVSIASSHDCKGLCMGVSSVRCQLRPRGLPRGLPGNRRPASWVEQLQTHAGPLLGCVRYHEVNLSLPSNDVALVEHGSRENHCTGRS